MLSGGRVLHHLKRLLPNKKAVIALVGFQAVGTRGRALENGAKTIRVHREDVPVRAQVVDLGSMSGHADREELLRWLQDLTRAPARTFVTHGEEEASLALANALRDLHGWDVAVPELGETFEI